MVYILPVLLGLILLFLAAGQHRRGAKKLFLPLLLSGILLVAVGFVLLFLVFSGALTFPLS